MWWLTSVAPYEDRLAIGNTAVRVRLAKAGGGRRGVWLLGGTARIYICGAGQGRRTKYIATGSRCEPDFSGGRTEQGRRKNELIQAKPVSATGGHTLRRGWWYGNGVKPRALLRC